MANNTIFKLEDGSCYFNILIKDEKGQVKYDLSKVRWVDQNVEVLAFRMVYTAGIALPIYEIIMTSSVKSSLELFNQSNTVEIYYGTSPEKKDTFECDTVGHNIKQDPQGEKFVLNWGGVVKKNKLNSKFLEAEKTGTFEQTNVYSASSSAVKEWKSNPEEEVPLNPEKYAIAKAWQEFAGTPLIGGSVMEYEQAAHAYNVPHITAQNAINDMLLHIDMRPSFPLAAIDKDGRLIIKDFQKDLKGKPPVATFQPARYGALGRKQRATKVIPYIGNPQPISFKTYVNRVGGYTQVNMKDSVTGESNTLAVDIEGQTVKPWIIARTKTFFSNNISGKIGNLINKVKKNKAVGSKIQTNTLATTQANEARVGSHVKTTAQTRVVNENNTVDYHEVELHNKYNLINMSAVQIQLRVEGTYLNEIHVLDMVNVETGIRHDKINGYWIVEAIEQGFVDGKSANIVYLCRDNLNDVEGTKASTFAEMVQATLGLSASDKATLTTMVKDARRALVVCQGVLDKTYIQEFQAHLIGMRNSALSNFNLFDTGINLTSAQSTVLSLKNNGAMLANKAIRSFIKDPYATFFYNKLLGDSNLMGLFMMILSSILGGDLYNSFSNLFSDLRNFDYFLDNYNTTLKTASQESQPNYAAAIIAGLLTYQESPTGELIPIVFDTNNTKLMRIPPMSASSILTDEAKTELRDSIISEIVENIPDSVDIPIPEISLTDSEAVLSREEVTEVIVDSIADDLIARGYVYDSDLIDNATTQGTIVIPDGSTISYDTAKATMLSSATLKDILFGKRTFDAASVNKITRYIGTEIKVRHWGTFLTFNDLTSFNINAGYVDKYKTVNCTKVFSCNGGMRIYVALPASEVGTKFYINSERSLEMENNIMEVDDLGYTDAKGRPIPYIIYYTTEDFDTSNLTLEMRKS